MRKHVDLKLPTPISTILMRTSLWRNNSFVLREFKHFRKIAISAIIFSLFAAVFEGITIGFITLFLQTFTTPDASSIKIGVDWFDVWVLGINTSASSRLYRVAILIFLTVWLRFSFVYLGNFTTTLAELNLSNCIRQRIFDQFQKLSLSFFLKKRAGELINNIYGEANQLRLAVGVTSIVISRSFTLLVYTISMFWLSWQLTVISILMFVLLAIGLSTLVKRVREASFEAVTSTHNFMSMVMEYITGIRTVQVFAAYDFEFQRFNKVTTELMRTHAKSAAAAALVQPITEAVASTILLVMLIAAVAVFVASGRLEIASLLAFLFVLLRTAPVVAQINAAWAHVNSFQGSLNSIKQLLKTDDKPYLQNGTVQFSGLKQCIEFVAVDFAYNPHQLVLQDITLTMKRGQMTALVGASGAGKSTIADLLPRFYDPTRGKILLDGVDLQDFDINTLRRKIAMVSQDTFIFNTSVRNNIAYAMEDVDEAAIQKAAQLANALEFIQNLPKGFDTQLGDRGVRLSGGQRQRIAIARALLRNPEILILDEATSALDSEAERLIQESIEQLAVGRTVIAIAHRLSTIVRADKVVVLEQGRIVEQGTYKELLERRGKLWKYHQMQHQTN
ncbi:heterocyst formation ABC transporter subunit HepA [Scytonema millei]|uniref:ABC transporter ATP-binding protein n=1 Tax=Scytonema millei VB511283 TaxID=1245923 RepID=A0A9X5E8K4_9CYAN|nr:heterocyst formation ABC transporter subunit HepA [Scytonema millei]NHC36027.1 ABC transporter ATP-binding protein [Scytonema millei VB511283]